MQSYVAYSHPRGLWVNITKIISKYTQFVTFKI